MSLRSLAIILLYIYTYYHLHPRLQPYSYTYHMYAYEAERWRACRYTNIAFSVNGYVSLTGFREFTPFPTCDTIEWTIENTALQTSYRSIITATHRALIIPSLDWATWRQRSWVQRPIGARGVLPAMTTIITITGRDCSSLQMIEIEYDRPNRVRIQFLRVNWARSPVEATYNGRGDLTPESTIPRTKGEVERRFTSQHSYDYIPSNWAKCAYLSLRVHLQL